MSYFEIWVHPHRVDGVLERDEVILSADVRVDSEPSSVSVEVNDACADAVVTLRNGLAIGLKGKGRGIGCVWRSDGSCEDGAKGGKAKGEGMAEGGKGSSSSRGGGLGKGGEGDYGGTAEHKHGDSEADQVRRMRRRRDH
jgi:hypothetical protein